MKLKYAFFKVVTFTNKYIRHGDILTGRFGGTACAVCQPTIDQVNSEIWKIFHTEATAEAKDDGPLRKRYHPFKPCLEIYLNTISKIETKGNDIIAENGRWKFILNQQLYWYHCQPELGCSW